ncbi:ribosomal protein S5 domain 2-like protein [Terfezia boudieri ATCC MYA-4762]|uniref:Ribosomal RNA-processing protein 43 n=1 Tax=Terfezia boudieri ATCC MYA-4762 TaxID=1051890 RepID=A0A3N4LSR1_9PEZI|nr:ribosomal protein S5 domain 2-like protein [Terfezia boudieri ATCC MYA-4762]
MTTNITPSLSFPPATYQKVDPNSYLLRHLSPTSTSTSTSTSNSGTHAPTRPSGRSADEFRPPTIHTSSLSHAHGSAVVRTGDTAVVCGVRGEILTLRLGEKKVLRSGIDSGVGSGVDGSGALKSYPLIVPNLELNTGCAAAYHPGPPSDWAQAMTQRIRSLLVDVVCPVEVNALRIVEDGLGEGDGEGDGREEEKEVKAYWVLYIDTVMISLDGNAFDAAWAAIIAALNDTKLPVARWDPDLDRVVCDPVQTRSLGITRFAFASSFGIFTAPPGEEAEAETWILADLDDFEEGVCEERILVVLTDERTIAKLEKGGGQVGSSGVGTALAGVKHLKRCTKMAGERWKIWNDLIKGKGKEKE